MKPCVFELLAELTLLDCALDDFHLEMAASFVATANNGCINIKNQYPGCVLPKRTNQHWVLFEFVQRGNVRSDEV